MTMSSDILEIALWLMVKVVVVNAVVVVKVVVVKVVVVVNLSLEIFNKIMVQLDNLF